MSADAHTVRAVVRDQAGKQHFRSWSTRKHTKDAIEKEIAEWKARIKAGATTSVQPPPALPEGAAGGSPAAPSPTLLPLAPFRLDLPEKTGATLCALGASKSGKSTALTHIYENYFKKDKFIVLLCSPSEHASTYDAWKGARTVRAQNFYPELQELAHRVQRKTKNKYKIAFFIDDVVDKKNETAIKKLFMTERNSRVYTLQALQSVKFLDRSARFNVNYVLGFAYRTPEGVKDAVECLFGQYLPGKNLAEKMAAYEANTRDHCFLFLDQLAGELKRCRLPAPLNRS